MSESRGGFSLHKDVFVPLKISTSLTPFATVRFVVVSGDSLKENSKHILYDSVLPGLCSVMSSNPKR